MTCRFQRSAAFEGLGVALVVVGLLLACGGDDGPTAPGAPDACGAFGAWTASQYVLPYPVGVEYLVLQGNCQPSGWSHRGYWRHGYDFDMPIGSLVTAARDGVVILVDEEAEDGDRERTNQVVIRHADGSVALYSHLTRDGALVEEGQSVAAGQPIALSGNTGPTSVRHLHFSVHACETVPSPTCPTLATNFSNTTANPDGLQSGVVYPALPPP